MKLPFKASFISLTIFTLFFSCLDYEYESDDFKLSDNEKKLIRLFASENGYPESMPIDSFVRYIYYKYPNESDVKDYLITFPKQDSVYRTLVLSDVLTTIGKGLRVHYEPAPYGGVVYDAYIDSIEIRTDSVIIIPGLNLSDCNLTHLPPEIGKLRVNTLNVEYNNLTTLPLGIMQLLEVPKYHSYTKIRLGGQKNFKFDSLPDTLKTWYSNVYLKQDFEDEY